MNLKYLNRRNIEISSQSWLEQSRKPHYCLILELKRDKWLIQASWVGVISTRELRPKPFLVEIFWTGKGKVRNIPDDVWCSTEDEARRVVDELAKEVFGG